MPVVVTNSGKNQLILIQKNYLSKWKILGRVWKWKLQSKCCSTNFLPVQLDAEYGLLTIQSQSYSSTDWSTNACKLSTLMYLQITILFLTVTSAYEYCAWCHIMWYHVIRTINKPVYSTIIHVYSRMCIWLGCRLCTIVRAYCKGMLHFLVFLLWHGRFWKFSSKIYIVEPWMLPFCNSFTSIADQST